MSLVRSWRAAVLRASGAVLLVPVGLLLAVGIAASLTGVGGIGSIGQLVAGPGLPPASIAEALSGAGGTDELTAVPVVPAQRSRVTGLGRLGARGSRPGAERGERRRSQDRSRRRSGRRPDRRRRPSRPPDQRPTTPPAAGPPAGPGTGPGGGPGADERLPGPPRQTGLIRRIGAQLDRVVRPLPAVGPPAADAVNTVVQLVDPPPAPPAAPLTPAG